LPLQKDIVGSLGGVSASSGGAPEFVGPAGLTHSRALAGVLRDRYGLVEDLSAGANGLAFWHLLRERGETLESVYGSLERTLPKEKRFILADFSAVLRTSVKTPIPSRELSHSCRHHRRLVELLEPGDYVVDFNWDSLMADALLYGCPFWYPRTGFGPWRAAAISAVANKSVALQSYVNLFHIHGSVLLFEGLKAGPESEGLRRLLYIGPPGYTEINSMGSLLDFSPADPHPKRSATDTEEWALSRGFLHSGGRWFRPLFVPPSMDKGEYRHWYHRDLRTAIHTVLPTTEAFLVIGYSFPPADWECPARC
jgi:hypothetical protein